MWDQLCGQVFTDYVFSIFPLAHRGMIANVLFGIAIFYCGLMIGLNWHKLWKPIDYFKKFIRYKLNEGRRLFKSKIADTCDAKSDSKIKSEVDRFRSHYLVWRRQVVEGISNRIKVKYVVENTTVERITNSLSNTELFFARYRESLNNDLDSLSCLIISVKTDWLADDFKSEALDEYYRD